MRKLGLLLLVVLLVGVFAGACLAEEQTLGPNMRVVKCKEFVSLREEASTKAKRLLKVPLGAEVLAWMDGGNEGEAENFLYCEYAGLAGYILEEYLEPIGETYDTGLGFSFLYNPYRLQPDPTMSESGKSILITWFGYGEEPGYMELMLPEVFAEDPQAYLEANTDYTETFTTVSGAVVTGGTRANEDYTLSYGFYIVRQGNNMVLACTTCQTQMDEIVEPDFLNVLKCLSFEK